MSKFVKVKSNHVVQDLKNEVKQYKDVKKKQFVKRTRYAAGPFKSYLRHSQFCDVVSMAVGDSKSLSDPSSMLMKTISMSRSFLSEKIFRIATGSRTDISTSAAGVLKYSITTGAVLNAAFNATTAPEFTALASLFDEVKVMGIRVCYNPLNPYNRGAVIVSVPIAILWDDEASLMPTNSPTGMGALVNRYPLYHEFSPDHSFNKVFMRPSPATEYDWTPVSAMGSVSSTLGGLTCVGDGGLTVSSVYGYMSYQFLCEWRVRV